MMLATLCTLKALLQTSFLSGDYIPGRWNSDNNGKKYSDQPVLNGLVGHFNLKINREIKAFNSLAITPVDLCIVKRRNPFPSIGIQKIRPPLQHQLAFVQMFRFMDIRRPHRIAFHMAHLPFNRILRP